MYTDHLSLGHCFQYSALGNSIAFGVGATNNYGYVYSFRDFLETKYPCVNLINSANSGFTSSALLHQLQNDTTARRAVKFADLITISIGGADLLNCLHADNIPLCLPKAVATFALNWPQIMNVIQNDIHSNAVVYVLTVYNPFKGDNPNYKIIEFFIKLINNAIKLFQSIYHYKVVDVYAEFQGKFTGTTQWKVCKWTHFCDKAVPPNLPDPHPTDKGHMEIARLHEAEFLKNP